MARTVRNAKLDTPSARAKLKQRREPYWQRIVAGCAVGYRKGASGGTWIARHYVAGGSPPLRYRALGPADDALDADGIAALSYAQAQERARDWFTGQARIAAGFEPVASGPYTVREAVTEYLSWMEQHRRGVTTARTFANAHILPALGDLDAAKLTTKRVEDWVEALATSGTRRRAKAGAAPRYTEPPADAEGRRRRRATANRVLGILKAALNRAWRRGKVPSDDAWRRVKPFHDVAAPVVRYLAAAEAKRLVNATGADFRPMVRAALLTGMRYGELAALRAADFNADSGTVLVRASKSGKPRHVVLTDEGRRFFAGATAGKASDALVLTRADGRPWGKSQQQRPLAEACKAAKISPAISFHVLRHSHGSTLAMEGVPMGVIAKQLGHADERMTQRHYAHLSPSYVAETIRANFPRLGIVPRSNVRRLDETRPTRRRGAVEGSAAIVPIAAAKPV